MRRRRGTHHADEPLHVRRRLGRQVQEGEAALCVHAAAEELGRREMDARDGAKGCKTLRQLIGAHALRHAAHEQTHGGGRGGCVCCHQSSRGRSSFTSRRDAFGTASAVLSSAPVAEDLNRCGGRGRRAPRLSYDARVRRVGVTYVAPQAASHNDMMLSAAPTAFLGRAAGLKAQQKRATRAGASTGAVASARPLWLPGGAAPEHLDGRHVRGPRGAECCGAARDGVRSTLCAKDKEPAGARASEPLLACTLAEPHD